MSAYETCPCGGAVLDRDGNCRPCLGDVLGLCGICGSVLDGEGECRNKCKWNLFETDDLDDPKDYLSKLFDRMIPAAFLNLDDYFGEVQEILNLGDDDEGSFTKLQICIVSLALYLTYRGIVEQFWNCFEFDTTGKSNAVGDEAEIIFDSFVSKHRRTKLLPTYVDGNYFKRWRRRYDDIIDENALWGFQVATLSAFVQQATFSYEKEPFVRASEDSLIDAGEFFYEIFHGGIRRFVGSNVLAGHPNVLTKIKEWL
jgi:hypothetical protein